MPPLDRRVYVRARGADWFDWTSVRVEQSILSHAAGFELTAVDRGYAQLAPGDEIEIRCGDQVALKGFVEQVEDRLSDTEHGLKITGRDVNGDMIDSAANPDGPMEFLALNLFELISKLTLRGPPTPTTGPLGFDFTFDPDLGGPASGDISTGFGEPFPAFAIEQGETKWSAIERACRLRGVLVYGDGRRLVIEKPAPNGRKLGETLRYGANVKSSTVVLKDSNRFAVYIVRGQANGTDAAWGAATTEVEGRALDSEVSRGRTLTIIGEGQVSRQSAELRAQWEAQVRAAQAQRLVIVTPGWAISGEVERAGGGIGADGQPTFARGTEIQLWALNHLVPVRIPKQRISADMLVETIEFSKTATEGTITTLGLVRADAYAPKPVIDKTGNPFENYLRDRGVRPSARPEEDLGEE